jgi:hypothetical protein
MTSLATYPKFSSIAFLNFELQQKGVKLHLNFHSKSISQNYGHALQKVVDLLLLRSTKLGLYFFEFSMNL